MRKLIKGFSLLEAMAALAVGSVVVISLIFFLKKYYDSQISEKVGADLVSVVTALDERFAVDGFSASNFKRTEWKTNSDVNLLLNSLNGIDSKCNGATWVPNVDDASVVAKYRKKKLLFCDLWKTRTPYDVDTKAELRIEPNNNQVVSFDIILFFKDKAQFESKFSNMSNALDVAKRSDSKNNSGKHVYGYVNINTGEEINRLKCSILNKNCGFKIALVTNEANTNIHLSTLGENKQIGKIAFSKGVLKPQTCQKWTQNADKTWTSETVICGIEKDDQNKISFHLNQTATDYVVMNKVCDVRSTKSDFLNAKVTTGTDMAPVYNTTVPCGIYSAANGTDFLVTNISDNLSVENLYSSNTYTNKTNANTLKVADIIVQNVTNVTLKTTSGNAGMESGLTAQTLTSTGNIETVNLKSNNPFTVSSAFKNEYLGVEKLLNVSNSLEIDNKLKTTTANINSDTNTNLFLSKGDFKLNGNINTKDFYETGILYAKNVDINGSMKIESSAAMGGYGEIGGVTNTARTGLATTSVLVDQHAFVNNDPSQNIYQIGVYDSANNLNFGVGNNGSLFIRNGLNVMGGDGSTKFSVDSSGSLTVNAPIVYFDGSGVAAQAQFYGDVYVSGNYYVTSMDRYVDVVDSSTNPNSITLDPRFFPGVSAYNLSLYRTNSLIYNKYRIDYYSNAMTNYQGYYNTVLAAINTPGVKGEKGEKGTVGDVGDVGNAGPQGAQGPQGPSGPFYDASRVIWLPKEVTCASSESQLKSKYNVSTISSWTYNDVIEGLCENYGDGAIKYFKRTTPLTNSCSAGQSEYDVYQCQPAKFRKEPYAFNYKTQGYFCLGDSNTNSNVSTDNSVIDTTKNTICYTDTNANHATAGRAGSIFGIYFSIGGNDILGNRSRETSLISTIGKNEWSVTATCGVANTRSAEDLKGIEMVSKIEDNYTTINAADIGTACSTKNEMKYRKVDASTSLVFGGPTNFENYEANSFKNVNNYVSKNTNVCGRAQLYEINVCTNTYTNLSQVNYTTHPKGFPMPQNQSTGTGSTGGLTGKYIWMKDQVVCVTGDIKNTYSDVSLWYSTDRLYDQCSVENATRYEKKGTCTDPNKTSYQLYRCKDSYYKPAGTGLSWSLSEVQCLNEDSTTGSIGNINDSYPNIEFFTKESDSSLECSNERTYKAYKDSSANCGASKSSKYYIYQCR